MTKSNRSEHLFEQWWAEFMPDAPRARAWAAWTEAQRKDGAGVTAHAPGERPSTAQVQWLDAFMLDRCGVVFRAWRTNAYAAEFLAGEPYTPLARAHSEFLH